MNIRLANKKDIEKVNILFKKVIFNMENNGINMWNDVYPFCEFETDISNKEMYIIEEETEIVGSFVLSNFKDPDFDFIKWTINSKKWISINRLAISPNQQGKGYAKEAIKFIEEYAKSNGYDTIKLTVYKNNINAIGLYENMKYKRVKEGSYIINGNVFVGYEKIIKKDNY